MFMWSQGVQINKDKDDIEACAVDEDKYWYLSEIL